MGQSRRAMTKALGFGLPNGFSRTKNRRSARIQLGRFLPAKAYLKAITAKSLLFCGQLRLRQIALFDSK
jgi:hypothetical protein